MKRLGQGPELAKSEKFLRKLKIFNEVLEELNELVEEDNVTEEELLPVNGDKPTSRPKRGKQSQNVREKARKIAKEREDKAFNKKHGLGK